MTVLELIGALLHRVNDGHGHDDACVALFNPTHPRANDYGFVKEVIEVEYASFGLRGQNDQSTVVVASHLSATEQQELVYAAAEVIAETEHIRKYLEQYDPRALAQLDAALRRDRDHAGSERLDGETFERGT